MYRASNIDRVIACNSVAIHVKLLVQKPHTT